jgi:phage-related protein (TIGR01555 family)
MWPFDLFSRKENAQTSPANAASVFSTDLGPLVTRKPGAQILQAALPTAPSVTMDSVSPMKLELAGTLIPDAQLGWYASQGFIGYATCALIAQHWLVDKACSMTGRDAIRQGYEINGDNPEAIELIKKADKRRGINALMREFVHMGRVFGVRIAVFKVESTDPEFYEKPFNLDGVTPGSYKGIAQIDPYWITPELDAGALQDPANLKFYEPTFYRIGPQRYHRSHLAIYIPHPVADVLKPGYQYGGVSVPQRIYERVYAAERTANEAPQLAMTKRLTTFKVPDAALGNPQKVAEVLQGVIENRDNFGVWTIGPDDTVSQIDTSLADLDAVIMSQYQLVAAIANVPATKLLGTTPKGFNATGDYEEASYREELESIQANDLTPLLERHHALVMRSDVAPKLNIEPIQTTVDWRALDSPTAQEWTTLNKTKAETDKILFDTGAIDGVDIRRRVAADKDSDHYGLEGELTDAGETDEDASALGRKPPDGDDQGNEAGLPGSASGAV